MFQKEKPPGRKVRRPIWRGATAKLEGKAAEPQGRAARSEGEAAEPQGEAGAFRDNAR